MSELRDRLQELRSVFGITQRQLAKRIGVTSQLVSMMETGKAPLSHLTAKAMEAEFGVDHEWLMTGNGEMLAKKPTKAAKAEISSELNVIFSHYPNIVKALNHLSTMMTLSDWEALNNFLSRNMQRITGECAEGNQETVVEE